MENDKLPGNDRRFKAFMNASGTESKRRFDLQFLKHF